MKNEPKNPFPDVRMWRGTFSEWRRAVGITQEKAALYLDCGRRKIQELEAGNTKYNLRRTDRIAMLAALEQFSERNRELVETEGV
jgi:hypothetical protein